jgi:hypothetical protein
MYYYEEEEIIGRVVSETEIAVELINDEGVNVALVELERVAQPSSTAIWLRDGLIVVKEYVIDTEDEAETLQLFNEVVELLKNIKDPFENRTKVDETLARVDKLLEGKFSKSERNPYYKMYD